MKPDVLRAAAGGIIVSKESDGAVGCRDAHEDDLFVPKDLIELECLTVETDRLLEVPHGYDEEEGRYLGH